jgi:hypothetical protein
MSKGKKTKGALGDRLLQKSEYIQLTVNLPRQLRVVKPPDGSRA